MGGGDVVDAGVFGCEVGLVEAGQVGDGAEGDLDDLVFGGGGGAGAVDLGGAGGGDEGVVVGVEEVGVDVDPFAEGIGGAVGFEVTGAGGRVVMDVAADTAARAPD